MRSPARLRPLLCGPAVVLCVLGTGCSAFAATDASDDRPFGAVVVPSQTDDAADDRDAGGAAVVVDRPSTVVMVGDSITVASADHLEVALAGLGLEVLLVDAQVGRRMTVGERGRLVPGADVIEYVSGILDPELWVVALGTNDIGQYPDLERVGEQVTEVLRRIPDGVPVVWIDTWIRDRPEQAGAINAAIREIVDRRPGSVVVDWAAHAAADGVLSSDGVHLTDGIGRARFAEVVADGVEAFIGPTPTPTP